MGESLHTRQGHLSSTSWTAVETIKWFFLNTQQIKSCKLEVKEETENTIQTHKGIPGQGHLGNSEW